MNVDGINGVTPSNGLLHVYAKNGRINPDLRQLCLLGKLSELSWGLCCFTETRLLSTDIILHGGLRSIGSLSSAGASGVAILIHVKYVKLVNKVIRISDRVLAVDVRIGRKHSRIMSVYLPHAGYSWTDFTDRMEQTSSLSS